MTTLAESIDTVGKLATTPHNSISSLRKELERRQTNYDDIEVKAKDIEMSPTTGALVIRGQEYNLREHAFSQLATKLKIPTPYLIRCEENLMADNVNHWLKTSKKDLLIRTDGSEVRAVLSNRYRIINHLDILKWLSNELTSETQLRYELSEKSLHLQVIKHKDTASGTDSLHQGLSIQNSEVGFSRVEIGALVFRTICLNGLIMSGGKWNYSRRHIGKKNMVAEVRSAFDNAIELSKEASSKFSGTRGIKVGNPEEALNRIAKRYELSELEIDAIKIAHKIEPDDTLFGVINALTRAGNSDKLTLESRCNLQKLGGQIMELAESGRRWLDTKE